MEGRRLSLVSFGSSCGEHTTFNIWELVRLIGWTFRLNITQTLTSLSSNGRPPSDHDMLRWANDTVRNSTSPNKPRPATAPIRSFKDPAISDGLFFLDLLDALQPGIVDYSMVHRPAHDYEEKRQNGEWDPSFRTLL